MRVRVVSPEAKVYEGEAGALVVPAWDGRVGILPGHAPFMALLGAGELSVDLPGRGARSFHVAGGVVKVEGAEVTVLAERAGIEPLHELPDEVLARPEEVGGRGAGNAGA